MADRVWVGGAAAVAQVHTYTPANVEIGDTFTLTATAEDGTTTAAVSFVATAATVANVTAGITLAWNNSSNELHTGITATDGTTLATLTADEAGTPFVVASTAVNGGAADTQTFTEATVTDSEGPNDVNCDGSGTRTNSNWRDQNDADAVKPANADTVKIGPDEFGVSHDILYGLDQSAIAPTSVRRMGTYRAAIGDTGSGYYLQYSTAALYVDGRGGGASWFDLSTTVAVVRYYGGQGGNALQLTGLTGASSLLVMDAVGKGTITIGGSSVVSSNIRISPSSAQTTVRWGSGTTLEGNLEMGSGLLITDAGCTVNSTQSDIFGSATVVLDRYVDGLGVVDMWGGSLTMISDTTTDSLRIHGGSVKCAGVSDAGHTITNVYMYGGSYQELSDNITYTGAPIFEGGKFVAAGGRTITPA